MRENQVELRRYVARRVPPAEVDDVVSEVFASAWSVRHRRPPEPQLWLYRSAHHLVLHEYRGRRRRERLAGRLAGQPRGSPPDPEQVGTSETDAGLAINAAMRVLAEDDRELLRLRYWEQLPIEDIAVIVDARPETTRVRLYRARRRVAAELPDQLRRSLAQPTSPAACTDLSTHGASR